MDVLEYLALVGLTQILDISVTWVWWLCILVYIATVIIHVCRALNGSKHLSFSKKKTKRDVNQLWCKLLPNASVQLVSVVKLMLHTYKITEQHGSVANYKQMIFYWAVQWCIIASRLKLHIYILYHWYLRSVCPFQGYHTFDFFSLIDLFICNIS